MKRIFASILLLPVLLAGCSKTSLCLPKGEITTREKELPPIENLITGHNMKVYIRQGNSNRLEVSGYENIMDLFSYRIEGDTLILETEASCLFRYENSALTVKLEVEDLKTIRNSGEYPVYSEDTLHFERLTLYSENFLDPSCPAIGDFYLTLQSNSVRIISNYMSMFYLTGRSDELHVGFYSGYSRFYGKDFQATRIRFVQTSVNDMEFYPLYSIEGDIYSTGNIILYHRPDTMNIRTHYSGRVIIAY